MFTAVASKRFLGKTQGFWVKVKVLSHCATQWHPPWWFCFLAWYIYNQSDIDYDCAKTQNHNFVIMKGVLSFLLYNSILITFVQSGNLYEDLAKFCSNNGLAYVSLTTTDEGPIVKVCFLRSRCLLKKNAECTVFKSWNIENVCFKWENRRKIDLSKL